MRVTKAVFAIGLFVLAVSWAVSSVAGRADEGVGKAGTSDASYRTRPKGSITFNKDIAPIIFNNCASCHRPGEVAPFSLLTYADAKKRAKQLAHVTETRFMPPWKADHSDYDLHGDRVRVRRRIVRHD